MPPDMIADDLLRMAFRITVGSVDKVSAKVDKAVQNLLGFFNGGTPTPILAEGHCAEAKRANAKARASK